MILDFGKYKGKELKDLLTEDMDYLLWLACNCYKARKEAQKLYEKHIKSTYKNANFKYLGSGVTQDLNFHITIEIDGKSYTAYYPDFRKMTEIFKPEQIESVTLELHQLLFKNHYQSKNGKYPQWIKADRVMDITPSVKIKFKENK